MIQIIKEITLEVSKPNLFQAIVAKQYDMNTRFLKATLVDGTDIINIPTSATAQVIINAARKDGQSKSFDGVINEDGTVTVPLHSWMLELDGTVVCDVSVIDTATDDNKKLTTTSFNLLVEKAAYGGDDITSDPQYDILVQLIEDCREAIAGVMTEEVVDAKIADGVKSVETRLNDLDQEKIALEVGTLNSSTGKENTAGNDTNGIPVRMRSDFLPIPETLVLTLEGTFKYCVFMYKEDETFIKSNGAWLNSTDEKYKEIDCSTYLTDDCRYIRVLINPNGIPDPIVYGVTVGHLRQRVDEIEDRVGKVESKYAGKYCSIYGDSMSTFAGYIPEGNRVYYTGTNAGVTDVSQTWWKRTIDYFGMNLLVNNSWSGRCVSNKRDTQENMTNSAGARLENVVQLATEERTPDVIIVRLGSNDFNYKTPIGVYNGTQDFPTDYTNFREAYAIMLNNITTQFPNAEIWCATIPYCRRGVETFPTIINSKTIADFNVVIIEMADLFGCKVLYHNRCGITYNNYSHYMGDNDSHPNAVGHELIAKETIREMSY